MSELRAASWTVSVPPPGFQAHEAPAEPQQDPRDGDDEEYVCCIRGCGRKFATQRQLTSHLQQGHGLQSILGLLTT
eukprot:4976262-Pyramimonas_sp.AAC.1